MQGGYAGWDGESEVAKVRVERDGGNECVPATDLHAGILLEEFVINAYFDVSHPRY